MIRDGTQILEKTAIAKLRPLESSKSLRAVIEAEIENQRNG